MKALLVVAFAMAICATPARAQEAGALEASAWIGSVSWSPSPRSGMLLLPPIQYEWRLDVDGRFASGRAGRELDGAGEWRRQGARLILKYDNGVRYDGALEGETYAGTAYRAEGSELGSFTMSRAEFDKE